MAIDRPRNNLYKIPHLSTMTYEDIKAFERFGVTPKDLDGGEASHDEQRESPGGEVPVG